MLIGSRAMPTRPSSLDGLVGFRPQEDVLAGLDQDPRFRLVARGDQADRQEGDRRRHERRADDRDFPPPQSAPKRTKVELLDSGLHDTKPCCHNLCRRLRTSTHHCLALTRTTRDSRPPFQTIMVDGPLRPRHAAADSDLVMFC
jgi:hypothetical protein